MRVRKHMLVTGVVVAALTGVLGISPAQAADANSIIVAKTGATAASVTTPQAIKGITIGTGMSAGKALDSFAQKTSTSVRMMATLTSPGSVDYSLALPSGAGLVPQPDGSLVISRDLAGPPAAGVSATEQFGTIAAPWAIDAKGTSLPTAYSYSGGVLTQKIDATGAAFPVVADPWLTYGWYVYFHMSRTETLNLYHGWQVSGTPNEVIWLCGAFIALGPVLGAFGTSACSFYLIRVLQDINATLWYAAHNYHMRMVIRFDIFGYEGSYVEYAP